MRTNPAARELIERRLAEVRERPEAIESVLIDLLTGPCAQVGDGERPLLLIIDDLEQILRRRSGRPASGRARVRAGAGGGAAGVRPAETDSRLLVTSRFTVRPDGLRGRGWSRCSCGRCRAVAQHKLQRRQQALTPPQLRPTATALAERAVAVCRGNPGLQDLIGLRLVYSEQVDLAGREAAVAGMEAYLHQGDLPADAEVREFLENLALDTLIEGRPDQRTSGAAAGVDGVRPAGPAVGDRGPGRRESAGRWPGCAGLGLLDRFPDDHDPRQVGAGRQPAGRRPARPRSTRGEQAALAAAAVAPLLHRLGRATARPPQLLDLQLTQLALLGDDPASPPPPPQGPCRLFARAWPPRRSSLASRPSPCSTATTNRSRSILLRAVADAALTSGDGATGGHCLNGRSRPGTGTSDHGMPDAARQGTALAEDATYLDPAATPARPNSSLRQAQQLFTTAGSDPEAAACSGTHRRHRLPARRLRRGAAHPPRGGAAGLRAPRRHPLDAAVTWGKIADIAFQRGDYDEALRIRREVELPVYERLGDARSAAVTWGKIADIAYRRGDYDEALRIRREEELPVYERLGDTRSAAVTWGKIADILPPARRLDEALRIRREVGAAGLRTPRRRPLAPRSPGARSPTSLPAGRLRRGAAHPPRGGAAGLRAPRRHPRARGHLGQDRRHACRRGRLRRGAAHPPRGGAAGLRTPRRHPLAAVTWGKIADIAFQRGATRRGAAHPPRGAAAGLRAPRRSRGNRRRELESGADRSDPAGLRVCLSSLG